MRNPPAKKIPVQKDDWQEFESRVFRAISRLEALFGLMATSDAEITDGGDRRNNPQIYLVGELGAQLLNDVSNAVFDSFEVREAETSPQKKASPAPDAPAPEPRPSVPDHAHANHQEQEVDHE